MSDRGRGRGLRKRLSQFYMSPPTGSTPYIDPATSLPPDAFQTPQWLRDDTMYRNAPSYDFDSDETLPGSQDDVVPNTQPGGSSSDAPGSSSSRSTDLTGKPEKQLLAPNSLYWLDNPTVASAVTASFQSKFEEPYTCLSMVPPEVVEHWWKNFREHYSWDPAHAQEVKKAYIKKLGTRLRDNVGKEVKKLLDRPNYKCRWMSDEVAAALIEMRSQPSFAQKSNTNKGNRRGREQPAPKSSQGSCASSYLAKKMAAENNGIKPPLHEVYMRQHTRKDNTTFVDDHSRSLMAQFEARKAANSSESDAESFYKVTGGYTKFGTVSGLGNATEMFYESPRQSNERSSGFVPSQMVQLQDTLRATQDELRSFHEVGACSSFGVLAREAWVSGRVVTTRG